MHVNMELKTKLLQDTIRTNLVIHSIAMNFLNKKHKRLPIILSYYVPANLELKSNIEI